MGKIEWSEHQWNPLAGCTMVSPGCTNCYAMKMAHRFAGVHAKYEGTTRVTEGGKVIWTGQINLDEKALMEPLSWKKPRRVFVNSMSDLFHESVPSEFIDKVFAVMAATPHITYMVLTKRPDRMANYLAHQSGVFGNVWKAGERLGIEIPFHWILPNVWLGTTVENQKEADARIPHLLNCPAAVRFLSCEPLLGPVDIQNGCLKACLNKGTCKPIEGSLTERSIVVSEDGGRTGECVCSKMDGIHWVIAGGESGREARPVHPDWIRSLRDQCQEAGVPFFFKQWGEWADYEHFGPNKMQTRTKESLTYFSIQRRKTCGGMVMIGKKAAGRLLDGREWNEFPSVGGSEGER